MTNLSTYLKNNLMGGYANGSFTAEQVSIYSVNYLLNGRLTQADFDEIQEMLNPPVVEEESYVK